MPSTILRGRRLCLANAVLEGFGKMKAIVYEKYGPPEVLQLKEVEKPTPKDNEVRVRIKATTVTIGDVFLRIGRHPDSKIFSLMLRLVFGLRKPRKAVLGMELAGDIDLVGKDVTRFAKGDRVFGSTFGIKFGGHAEYKCFPQDGMLLPMPGNTTYGEAATLPGGGVTALRCLRKAHLKNGHTILVNGASGAVGTNAIQLAKYFGAVITGVCSTANLELVKSLGADTVIVYTEVDITESAQTYDVVFDAVGKLPKSRAKKVLKKTGVYLNVLKDSGTGEEIEELEFVKKLVEAGELKPVIDKHYSFEQIVDAHRYVEQGHKRGNVVITV
jgi:NADPH:quinone reductase-like Zn-dependent oxidoreductase